MSGTMGNGLAVAFIVARCAAAAAALLAATAAVGAAGALASVDSAALMVEVWRALGIATFCTLFVLLAVRPLSITLWSIVLGNKLVLFCVALTFGSAVPGAVTAAAWDGVLVALLSVGLVGSIAARRKHHEVPESAPKPAVFDHLGITVRDLPRATMQFDALMRAMGFTREDAEGGVSWWKDGETELILLPTSEAAAEPHRHGRVGWQHLAFAAKSRADVDRLYGVALDAGWTIVRAPKIFPQFNDRYYASFVEDDSGIRIEFMHNPGAA